MTSARKWRRASRSSDYEPALKSPVFEPQLVLPGVRRAGRVDLGRGRDGARCVFVHATVMRAEVVAALAPRAGGVTSTRRSAAAGTPRRSWRRARSATRRSRSIAIRPRSKPRASGSLRSATRVTFVHAPFGELEARLAALGVAHVAGVCADLGVSSPQLDDPARGMSFRHEGPLDMRMDPSTGETALELIERLSDDELADVIYHSATSGARGASRGASSARARERELATTLDLRRAIVRAVGPVRVGGDRSRDANVSGAAHRGERRARRARVAARRAAARSRRRRRRCHHQLSLARRSPREARVRGSRRRGSRSRRSR